MRCVVGLWLLAAVVGCDDDGDPAGATVTEVEGDTVPFGTGGEVVVADDGTFGVDRAGDDACVDVAGGCVDLAAGRGRYCDDREGVADVAVVDGEVVAAVCYPSAEEGVPVETVVVDTEGGAELPQNANGRVLVFDPEHDGEVLEGDLVLNGERATLYGNGTENTILGGDLVVASNNARVRGLTVQGDLRVGGNNVGLSHCRIQGNLVVDGNGVVAIGCEVLGEVQVSKNGATFAFVQVAGGWAPGGGATCHEVFAFTDADGDLAFDADERGEPLLCD